MDINTILTEPCHNGCSRYGARMGRRNQTDGTPERLHLQRLRMVNMAYDTGGAYWGMGTPLWCAFSPAATDNEEPVMVFVRASTRREAKGKVLSSLPGEGWKFYR